MFCGASSSSSSSSSLESMNLQDTDFEIENAVNPLLSPKGADLFQAHLSAGGGGRLNRDRGLI